MSREEFSLCIVLESIEVKKKRYITLYVGDVKCFVRCSISSHEQKVIDKFGSQKWLLGFNRKKMRDRGPRIKKGIAEILGVIGGL